MSRRRILAAGTILGGLALLVGGWLCTLSGNLHLMIWGGATLLAAALFGRVWR